MYQGRKILNTLPALIAMAMLAVCKVAPASGATSGANLIFSYPSGLSAAVGAGAIHLTGSAALNGSGVNILGGPAQHQAASMWYSTQQNITSFTTDFTFQLAVPASTPAITALTFCIQNSPAGNFSGINATADANGGGYGAYDPVQLPGQTAVVDSVAIKFDISGNVIRTYPTGGSPSATGLYINGGTYATLNPAQDLNPYGINLNLGHIMAAHIVYDGSILTMTLRDTVTNAQFRTSWPVNIPAITGNSAWVGFTAGTIPVTQANVLTWDFYQGYNPRLAAPTFSVTPGLYPTTQSVSLSAPAGSTIYYSTNGQQPTTSSTKYTGTPISVSSSQIIQAVAIQSGSTDSVVAVGNYQIGASGTPLISLPGGFTSPSGLVTTVGAAKVSGSQIQLTDTNAAGMEVGAAWYDVPVPVTSFTTHFTVQFTSATGNGMTFCIQNTPPASIDGTTNVGGWPGASWIIGGPNAFGSANGGLGYSATPGTGTGSQGAGLLSSVAVKFDVASGNTTGLYTDGAIPSTPQTKITGVNLNSGNPLDVTLSYNGTTLSMTVTDTKTNASFSNSWTIDIPTTVGGNTAYVGFTASTGYSNSVANQYLSAWTYSSSAASAAVAVPAAPTNLHVQ
jgi:Legume lectin domain/Chitobiase/beta-hexosaminidase C-terminal domain